MGKKHEYRSEEIIVIYEPARCIHVANCVRGIHPVFDPDIRPWIRPENGSGERIAEVVLTCPTGALHFRRLDGGAEETPDVHASITPARNGPLFIRGEIEIYGEDGELLLQDTRVALCRCGASANKPFCDGSHNRIGFVAE